MPRTTDADKATQPEQTPAATKACDPAKNGRCDDCEMKAIVPLRDTDIKAMRNVRCPGGTTGWDTSIGTSHRAHPLATSD